MKKEEPMANAETGLVIKQTREYRVVVEFDMPRTLVT